VRARYIVIEGLIGVGKTSLCRILERNLGARVVLEPSEDNPFLARFYDDPERFALPAQLFYLATRHRQQLELRQQDLFTKLIVADYLWQKDRLFAEMTLAGAEYDLYDRFASLLSEGLARPDFVLFLDSPTDIIMQRIERRGISAEHAIEASYLDELRERYNDLWRRYTDAPVHRLNTAELNYVDDLSARLTVLEMIRGWLDGLPTPASPASASAEREEQPSLFGAGSTEEG